MTPFNFFDLSQYAHPDLLSNIHFVWEGLLQIIPYLKSQALGKIEGTVSPQAFLINPEMIVIGKGTIVEPGAYIQGPCMIGQRCQIRHGAYIRGQVIIGDDCIVGHDTEIKHSILLNRAKASHFNYIGDSILGHDVNLGAGVKCANMKLDHSEVTVSLGGQVVYQTGLEKMGAIIGDGAQLGCNAVTSPGTLIGPQAIIYPCLHVQGYIADRKRIKNVN